MALITCSVCGWTRLALETSWVIVAFDPDGGAKAKAAAFKTAEAGEGDRVCTRCANRIRGTRGLVVLHNSRTTEAQKARIVDFVSVKLAAAKAASQRKLAKAEEELAALQKAA